MVERIGGMRKRRDEGGFTLIELLVVIIILGVLSAVVVFAVRGTGDKGKVAAVKTDARTIRTAQGAFCAKTGTFGTTEQLLGEAPAPDGNTYKFLSEKPFYNNVVMVGGNQCGTDPLTSGYVLTSGPNNPSPGGGGPFIVGFGPGYNAPNILNPAVTTAGTIQPAAAPLFNGLTGLSSNATAVPELAESWKITNNGANYKFILRPGVTWSDGQPLLAEDVKFSYEAALLIWHARTSSSVKGALSPACIDPAPGTQQARRLACSGITANEADAAEAGKRTVTFNFARPYGPLLQQTTITDGAILPSHIWGGCASGVAYTAASTDLTCPRPKPPADQAWPAPGIPVGTGPFVVNAAESNPTTGLVFDRNPNYWRTGIPYFNKMRLAPQNTLAALQAGTIDYLPGLGTLAAANAAKADSGLTTDTGNLAPGGSSNCIRTVMFNLWTNGQTTTAIKAGTATPDAILGDPALGAVVAGETQPQPKGLLVRKAIAMALEREPGVNGANAGYASLADSLGAKMADSPTNSNMPVGYTPAPLPAYDKNKAEAYLDAAGFPRNPVVSGPRFNLGLTALAGGTSPDTTTTAIRDNLAAVGITIVANPPDTDSNLVDSPNNANNYFGSFNGIARDFDVLLVSSCQGTDPEMGTRRVYHSDAIIPAPFTNGSGYFRSDVDGWFNDARASLDTGVRNSFYKKINDQVAKDLPTLWLTETLSTRAWKATCSGFRPWTGAYAEFGSCLR